jgi:hypothetical protein
MRRCRHPLSAILVALVIDKRRVNADFFAGQQPIAPIKPKNARSERLLSDKFLQFFLTKRASKRAADGP